MGLSGKVVVVTGASRGIGLATAQKLAASGAHVYGVSRHPPEAKNAPADVTMLKADVQIRDEVYRAVGAVLSETGRIDVLVNNAGTEIVKPLVQTSDQEIETLLDTNLKGALHFIRAVLPAMQRQKTGHLVFVNSVSGLRGFADDAAYCASKHGLTGLADALDEELRPYGIRVTSIHPGATNTTFALDTWSPADDPRRPYFLRAEDVASTILYAISLPARVVVKQIVVLPMIELAHSGFLPIEVIEDLTVVNEETTILP